MSKPDPIALVEACYDLAATEEGWLQGIADNFLPLVPSKNLGVMAYNMRFDDFGASYSRPVQAGGVSLKTLHQVVAMSEMMDRYRLGQCGVLELLKAKTYVKFSLAIARMATTGHLLSQMKKRGPSWVYTFGDPGVRDILFLFNHHLDGLGATVVGSGLSETGSFTAREKNVMDMLSAHLKSGRRLRNRLGTTAPGVDAPADGAVLDSQHRVVHADGEARDASAILKEASRAIDRARSARSGRDELALQVWTGLIDGRWSLVERFDSDGRRYLLAHRNPEDVIDPRGLTNMESRVTGLAVRGYSNKLIAYHLGISEGTASTHLHHAMRKLKLTSRVELVRLLGTHYPQKTDPKYRK